MSIEITTTNLLAEMQDVLKIEVAQRHSYFQLKYFLIGKEPTHQSKLWQCIREMKTRKDSLVAIDLEIEESKDLLKLANIAVKRLQHQIAKTVDTEVFDHNAQAEQELNVAELTIRVRQAIRQEKAAETNIAELEERKKWLMEEAMFFLESYKNLVKIEPIKHFDDFNSQKQYWGEKLSQIVNLKMLLQSPLDIELVETILSLPDDIPIKVQTINRLNSVQNQLLQLKAEYQKKILTEQQTDNKKEN